VVNQTPTTAKGDDCRRHRQVPHCMRATGHMPDRRINAYAQGTDPEYRPGGGLRVVANDTPGKPEQSYAQPPANHVNCIGITDRMSWCSSNLIKHLRPDGRLPWFTVKVKRPIRHDTARNQHVVIQLVNLGRWRERDKEINRNRGADDRDWQQK